MSKQTISSTISNSDSGGEAQARDALLIEKLRARDMDAFEEFYKAFRPRLRSFIYSIVKDDQQADEVFNDTMMTVWNKISDFAGRSKLSTWVFTIAYRRAIKEKVKSAKQILKSSDEIEEQIDEGVEQGVEIGKVREILSKAIASLPEAQSSVVRLAYFNEMGYREIAEVLDCPVDTVKTRIFHARRKLKATLGGSLSDWA